MLEGWERHIIQLSLKRLLPKHKSRAATKGKLHWCDIITATKLLPGYKLKLADDLSSNEDERWWQDKKITNDDKDLEMETIEKDDEEEQKRMETVDDRLKLNNNP